MCLISQKVNSYEFSLNIIGVYQPEILETQDSTIRGFVFLRFPLTQEDRQSLGLWVLDSRGHLNHFKHQATTSSFILDDPISFERFYELNILPTILTKRYNDGNPFLLKDMNQRFDDERRANLFQKQNESMSRSQERSLSPNQRFDDLDAANNYFQGDSR